MTSALYQDAVRRLRELIPRAAENRDYRHVVDSKEKVLARYGRIFSLDHIPRITAEEFRSFLRFENNCHWRGLQIVGPRITQDMGLLRDALTVLLDESKPIAERLEHVINTVPGMNKGVATPILLIAYPDKYGVWNNVSQNALKLLGLWPPLPHRASLGQQYKEINKVLLQLCRDLNVDLWTLDAVLWYAQTQEGRAAIADAPLSNTHHAGSPVTDQPQLSADVPRGAPEVWWVNQGGGQGRTFRSASQGGYIWAPLRDRRGGTPPHWRRMEEVRPGDIILHYSEGFVRAISRVKSLPERAPYPDDTDRDYGGREGNLIRTEYELLDPPVPRSAAANLQSLSRLSDHPFTSSGNVREGYLFRFGLEALRELIKSFDTNWPQWVKDVLHENGSVAIPDHPLLKQSILQIRRMKLGTYQGVRLRYKPLMLLAAARALVDGDKLAFSRGPLVRYYREFAGALGVDSSHPGYPYFHLSNDGFWSVFRANGEPFVSRDTPSQRDLDGTFVQLSDGLADCIRSSELRPYVLGAVKTYFNDTEWDQLTGVWGELAKAVNLGEGGSSTTRDTVPPPDPNLQAVINSFLEALQESHLRFEPAFVRTFVACLATKPFAILTGLSGSGKTQLALQFGRWLGPKRVLLVPVRPDWTGSDALFGYEDALKEPAKDGRRAWHVPVALEFMLRAASDPDWPYLLILDEMNLAHVERYFADVLSGMESGEPCLPNLAEEDGHWRLLPGQPEYIPVPKNLFIVGTVNVDETTYMFSPKVLDRGNTIEFRVRTEDLADDLRKPVPCEPGPAALVRGFLALAQDADWHVEHPHPEKDRLSQELRRLHGLLLQWGFEFGHRVFTESLRFAAMLAAAGEPDVNAALDAIVMQKVLPRLHGNRRRLEPVLAALGAFAFYPDTVQAGDTATRSFNLLNPPGTDGAPRLPRSFAKLQRMMANLQANQFTSFAE